MKKYILLTLSALLYLNVYGKQKENPDSDPVGAVQGAFNISQTGAATYSIPIDIPQGVGGMQPSIAITYNSQAGNGIVGWGCNLSGLSVITRGPKTVYYDQIAKGMNYDANDAFYLDGQRLIYSGGNTYGTNGAIYQFESDPLTKIEILGAGTLAEPLRFQMLTSDGTKYHYGSTNKGRHSYENDRKIKAWYLDYVEDAMGNSMSYDYYNYDNVIYLNTITYGKYKKNATDLNNVISFIYTDNRKDPISIFFDNQKRGEMKKRLWAILSTSNGATYRRYELEYDAESEKSISRLAKVTIRNAANEILKPLNLNWPKLLAPTQSVKSPNFSNAPSGTTHANQTFISGDFNGDGLTDIMGIYNNGVEHYAYPYYASKNISNISFSGQSTSISLGQNVIYNKDVGGAYNRGIVALDINQDGSDDLVIPYFNSSSKSMSFRVIFASEKKVQDVISIDGTPRNTFNEVPLFSLADLNNDGCAEVIYLERGVVNSRCNAKIITISREGKKINERSFVLSIPHKPEKMFISDFDNDGLQDLLVFHKEGYIIFFNQGANLGQDLTLTSVFCDEELCKLSRADIKNAYMVRAGDFNGDGMMDFLINDTDDSNWYFGLNQGGGFFKKTLACNLSIHDQSSTDKDNDKFDCHVYDFDSDGRTDAIISKTMYDKDKKFSNTYTFWLHSDGTRFALVNTPATSKREDDANPRRYIVGDFNGDGQSDLINYGYNCYSSIDANVNPGWKMYVNSTYQPGYGKISSIIDGYGNQTDITYASLTDVAVYTKGSYKPAYPMKNLALPIHGVSKIATSNGMGGFINTTYKYQGFIIHLTGKGLLGMTSQTVDNTTLGVTTETGVKSWNENFGHPNKMYTKQTLKETGVTTTSETETSLKVIARGQQSSRKYFVHPETKIETDSYNNKVTTSYTYASDSNFENWRLTSEKVDFGNNMYKTTTYSNHVLVGSTVKEYKPRLITLQQKHSDDVTVFTQKTDITYNTTNGLQSSIVETTGTNSVTTNYTYDNVGNVLTTKVSKTNRDPVTTTLVYDKTKRFVAKSTQSPSKITKSFIYDVFGNLTEEVDETLGTEKLLITKHQYDSWQNPIKTTHPDGRVTTIQRGWLNNYQERYTLAETEGEPWEKTYYDRLGRVIMVETIGAKGMKIEEKTRYSSKGFVSEKTTKTGNIATSEGYGYYLGKIASIRYNGENIPRVTYSYGNKTKSTTIDGKTHTETYDAWGNVKSVKDPVSTILYTYHSSGNPKQIKNGNDTPVTMTYYDTGQQKTLTDPNAGTTTYTYDAAGSLTKQVNAKGTTTKVYDKQGRITNSTVGGVVTNYTYGTTSTSNDYLRLKKIQTGTTNNSIAYTYDKYGRATTETRQIEDVSYTSTYNYNAKGEVSSIVYPNNLNVSHQYDNYGNLIKVLADGKAIWELKGATGQLTTTQLGGTLTATQTRNAKGFLTNIKTVKGTTAIHNMNFIFDEKKGNLSSRTGMIAETEIFQYDDMNRLTNVVSGTSGKTVMKMDYAANGNINSKTGLGLYGYGTKPHAVTSIENIKGLLSENPQTITYTAFGKVATIAEKVENDNFNLGVTYGPDQQRQKTVLKKNNSTVKTTIFAGDYEKITENGVTKELCYISGGNGLAAVYVKQAGQTNKIYYPHTDHLGSIVKLTDGNGTEVFRASYDAWGKQTVSTKTFAFHRGYTGHEHLPEFRLINMNGRMYDPVLARFLSPDPYVQAPLFGQNFNRYSYCLNNPLVYTDPSGEFIIPILIGMAIGATVGAGAYTVNVALSYGGFNNWSWNGFGNSILIGAASGAAFTGMGLIAPSFVAPTTSFMGNLPTYLGKAGYAALTGSVSAGAGMLTSDLLDDGKINTSGKNYLKGMSTAALSSGLASFGKSVYDYITWDKYSYGNRVEMLRKEIKEDFNLEYRKPMTKGDYGEYDYKKNTMYLSDASLATKGLARHVLHNHEKIHYYDFQNVDYRKRYDYLKEKDDFFELRAHLNITERNAYTFELQNINVYNIPYREYNIIMMNLRSYGGNYKMNQLRLFPLIINQIF